MRAAIKIALCLVVVAVIVATIIQGVVKVRDVQTRVDCQQHLKSLGLGLHGYHDANKRFPTGTVANPALPPEKRLSWLVAVVPAYIESSPRYAIYLDKAWDAPEHSPPKLVAGANGMGFVRAGTLVGRIGYLICPTSGAEYESLPSLTTYLGSAGVGENAAGLPLEHSQAASATIARSR
jgi:hypothetical protein